MWSHPPPSPPPSTPHWESGYRLTAVRAFPSDRSCKTRHQCLQWAGAGPLLTGSQWGESWLRHSVNWKETLPEFEWETVVACACVCFLFLLPDTFSRLQLWLHAAACWFIPFNIRIRSFTAFKASHRTLADALQGQQHHNQRSNVGRQLWILDLVISFTLNSRCSNESRCTSLLVTPQHDTLSHCAGTIHFKTCILL